MVNITRYFVYINTTDPEAVTTLYYLTYAPNQHRREHQWDIDFEDLIYFPSVTNAMEYLNREAILNFAYTINDVVITKAD